MRANLIAIKSCSRSRVQFLVNPQPFFSFRACADKNDSTWLDFRHVESKTSIFGTDGPQFEQNQRVKNKEYSRACCSSTDVYGSLQTAVSKNEVGLSTVETSPLYRVSNAGPYHMAC